MLIGFSTGCFYKTRLSFLSKIQKISDGGYRALELGFLDTKDLEADDVEQINWKDLAPFSYVSLHAPAKNVEYGRNNKTREVFEKIRRLNGIRPFDWVVIHPDKVADFSVFRNCGFNAALENMDNRKQTHKTPKDLVPVLDANPDFGFVLDVNHIFSNDSTMDLAERFYEAAGPRVCEIHLSGYRDYHVPLFETRQEMIVRAIQNFEVPIIIESVLQPEDTHKEADYINGVVRKIKNSPA